MADEWVIVVIENDGQVSVCAAGRDETRAHDLASKMTGLRGRLAGAGIRAFPVRNMAELISEMRYA